MLRGTAVVAGVLALSLATASPADACRRITFELTPTENLQIVIWVEDGAGNFIETLYMTDKTGRYGLGNRPGRYDFNSEWQWPYGRREQTFPIWAARSPVEYPRLVFQNGDDSNLSHPIDDSSPEPFYCRPLKKSEVDADIDAMTCASAAYTDKGKFSPELKSKYPPRNDMVTYHDHVDHTDMLDYEAMNALDAISQPTPPGGRSMSLSALLSSALPEGSYVAWVEVSKEFDQNEFHDYPAPIGIPWSEYGQPGGGQPSIVWRLPFEVDSVGGRYTTLDYFAYGDPAGANGMTHPPDETITTGVDGSGAGRLLAAGAGEDAYRFAMDVTAADDVSPPGAIAGLTASVVEPRRAELSFPAPADDTGLRATEYQVRFSAGTPMTADTFLTVGQPVVATPRPAEPGQPQTLELPNLSPETHYWVGVRALDGCLNAGPLVIFELETPAEASKPVDGCACRVGARPGKGTVGGALTSIFLAGLALRRRRRR